MRRGRAVSPAVGLVVGLVAMVTTSPPAAADRSRPGGPAPAPGDERDVGGEVEVDIQIAVDGCEELRGASLRRIAALEVEAVVRDRDRARQRDGERGGGDTIGGALALSLDCRDQTVELTGGWAGGAPLITRRFPLAEAPATSRARYLALALAEVAALVLAGRVTGQPPYSEPADWMPPAPSAPSPSSPSRGRPTRTGAPPPASSPRPTAARAVDTGPTPRLAAIGAIGRATFSQAGRMQGAGVRLAGLGWLSADVIFEYGRRPAMLGHVSVLAGSVGFALDLGRSWGRVRVAGGPGARIGVVRFEGVPVDSAVVGSSFTGPTAGPFAAASVRCAIVDRVELYAAGEAGAALVGTRSKVESSAAALRTTGTWLAVDLGARWGW